MALNHFARCSGILAFGFTVEVAGPDGDDVQAALPAQSESPTERGESAVAEAPAAPAAFLQGLMCVRLRSLFTFFTGSRSGSRFAFRIFAGIRLWLGFPMLR